MQLGTQEVAGSVLLATIVALTCIDWTPTNVFFLPYPAGTAQHFRRTAESELLPGERQSNGWPSDDSLTAGVQRFFEDGMGREGCQ